MPPFHIMLLVFILTAATATMSRFFNWDPYACGLFVGCVIGWAFRDSVEKDDQ
jgi:hypothetical protein